jgi:two-component system, LytTR family, sensor kinase
MDHPPQLRKKLIRYPGFGILFIVWTLLGGLAWARHSLVSGVPQGNLLPDLLGFLTCYYPWLLFTPLVFRLEQRYPLDGRRWPQHLVLLALAGLPLSYLAGGIGGTLSAGIQHILRQPFGPNPWWPISVPELALEQALYWLTVGGGFLIRSLIGLHEKERLSAQLALEKAQLESSLRQAELETLRMRLNPHFLFNSLQNISTLSQQDPKTAAQMLTKLGDLLRMALKGDIQSETPLEKELALTQAYVAIEKMRFGDRLSVLIDVARGTERALVPSFLLQPLVENAIRHGLQADGKSELIWIRTIMRPKDIVLTVSDNSKGLPVEKFEDLEIGIGLGSTCQRLARMYGERHTFSMQRLPEGGTEVRIVLPLKYKGIRPETASREQPAPADRR